MKTAVIGAGAWGTALALCLYRNGHHVTLWCHSAEKASRISSARQNPRLPHVTLPDDMIITADPGCVRNQELVVIATPSYPIRSVCRSIAPFLPENVIMVSVTKGLEAGTLLRMSQVVETETHHPVVALTGPSHAEEVAAGVPTGCVAACCRQDLAEKVQDAFMADNFRVYTSPDTIGAELGGAMKNVIALCAGVCRGLGYGDNTVAMLMTRGLTEIARLGVSLGASKDTLAGLSGIGDLIVTCTSGQSRNLRAGILIGQGYPVQDAMEAVGAVVEGYYASKSVWELCQQRGIEMPILQAAYHVLYQGLPAREAVQALLQRHKKAETENAGWN